MENYVHYGKKPYHTYALVFKALSDETRLKILDLLHGGEQCACVLLEHFDIAQSTLSHHMKILLNSGVISARQKGKWTYYSLSVGGCADVESLLHLFLNYNTHCELGMYEEDPCVCKI